MTKKQSEMTPDEIARVRALALAWRQKNRDRINAAQNAKRAAARAINQPSAEDVERLRALRAERRAAYKRGWAAKNAEYVKAKRRDKYAQNRARNIASAVEWNRANKGRRQQIVAAYEAANPDQRRACKARRRAREAGAEGSFTPADVRHILRRQMWCCATCATDLRVSGYEVDHWMPLARGGSNDPLNLQALCPTCNRRKGAKDPLAFWRELHGGAVP